MRPGENRLTLEQPVGVARFGGVGAEERQNVLGHVVYHLRLEGRVGKVRQVLRLDQRVLPVTEAGTGL